MSSGQHNRWRMMFLVLVLHLLLFTTSPALSANTLDVCSDMMGIYDTLATTFNIFAANIATVPIQDGCANQFGARLPNEVSDPAVPQSLSTNYPTTAFRMDELSELLISTAVLLLEADGKLPFGRDAPIPIAFLPPALQQHTYLVSPHFPTIPITINMLMRHTSTLTEANFTVGEAQAPGGHVATLDEFMEEQCSSAGDALFSTQCSPGTCYLYARTNVALLSYMMNRVLQAQHNVAGYDIGSFIVSEIFPKLGMAHSFILNQRGDYPAPSYPAGINASSAGLSLVSMAQLDASGAAPVASYEIHAAYTTDYMIFTTMNDVESLARTLLVPGGSLYSVGHVLLSNPVAVPNNTPLRFRSIGLYNMSATALCASITPIMKQVGVQVPFCTHSDAERVGNNAYGFMSGGQFNHIAIICLPPTNFATSSSSSSSSSAVIRNDGVLCTAAQVSLPRQSSPWTLASPSSDGTNVAAVFAMAMVSLQANQPSFLGVRPVANSGLWAFLGILAALALVIFSSCLADYLIQPAPPAKVIVPIPAAAAVSGLPHPTSHEEEEEEHDDDDDDDDDVAYEEDNSTSRGDEATHKHSMYSTLSGDDAPTWGGAAMPDGLTTEQEPRSSTERAYDPYAVQQHQQSSSSTRPWAASLRGQEEMRTIPRYDAYGV